MKKLLLIVLISGPVFASGDKITQSNDMNNQTSGDVTTGDVSTGDLTGGSQSNSSKSIALVNSLGDVDINDCLGSTQWATPVFSKQKLNLNKWCAAEVYDSKGMHSMAGRIRCEIPEIEALFDDHQQCVLENTVLVPAPIPATTVPMPPVADEGRPPVGSEGYRNGGMDPSPGVELVQMEIETLEQRVARIERENRITEQKSQERRDYAQHTIEKLKYDPDEE